MPRGQCCYCGKPAWREKLPHGMVIVRAWCESCLKRIRTTGHVDGPEYMTWDESRRTGAPDVDLV